jgi:type II secretory pathway predicted ATPase ExeA/cell division protein FtsN
MYNKFFGFKEKPFKLVPNPEYLFLSKSHEEALAHLTYAISQGDGFMEITGEVGTGKTTLCRVFLENLDKSIEAAYIFNPKLDAFQLIKAINDEFGIDSKPDNTKDLIDRLNTFLIEKKSAGQKVLVLIDEAQNLSLEVLEQLRLLSNLETTREKLLQIILVGQPELGDMLSSHQLRQLGQRITINCQLSPLTYEETKEYIRHRIALASLRAGPPFDKVSLRAIYEYSRGIPRLINIACDRTLLNAFSHNSFKITGSITKEALRELTRKKTSPSQNSFQRPSGLLIAAAICIPLVILMLYLVNEQSPQTPVSSTPSPSELVTQVEARHAIPESEPVSAAAAPEDKPATPQTEVPLAIQEDEISPNQPGSIDNKEEPLADQVVTGLTTPEAESVSALSVPQEKPVTPLANEESLAHSEPLELRPDKSKMPVKPLAVYDNESGAKISEDAIIHSVHVGTFQSASQAKGRVEELQAIGYPSFMYTQESPSGNTIFSVVAGKYQSLDLAKEAGRNLSKAGYRNFVARAKDSLAAGPTITEQQDQPPTVIQQPLHDEDTQSFLNYLKGLNSRNSRNTSMEKILALWFPSGETKIDQTRIYTDRVFFQEAAKQFDLQVQPIATESDLAIIQTLNLPAIFTFYLVGHSWPKYLAVANIDKEKIYFIAGDKGQTISVDRALFIQYWSGEAYVFWKDFKNLPGMISQRSRGQDIITLKKLLQQLGYSNVSMTDKYDNNTLERIKAIQTKYGLHIDGLVGPLTKIALYNESREFIKPSLVKFEAARTENGS